MTDNTGRFARWCLRLSEFGFDGIHYAGAKQQAAYALSCLPATGKDHTVINDGVPVLAIEVRNENLFDFLKRDASQDEYILYTATQHPSDNAPLSGNKIIAELATDSYCRAATFYISTPRPRFYTNRRGILIRKPPLDMSIRIVVPPSLQRRILHLRHYPPIARHPDHRRMYDMHWCDLYWTHMASDVQGTVAQCVSHYCKGSRYCHKRPLPLFSASGHSSLLQWTSSAGCQRRDNVTSSSS